MDAGEVLLILLAIFYIAGLFPAFDAGRKKFGWSILILGPLWPLTILWDKLLDFYEAK